jgi:hypothetical protein
MPVDPRSGPHLIAVVLAGVIAARRPAADAPAIPLSAAAHVLNDLFAPALAEPFAPAPNGLQGALGDPAQAPLCVGILREHLAPLQLRVGVGIGSVENDGDPRRDPFLLARAAFETAVRERGLLRYLGSGSAGDVLLNAVCRLVDPLIGARTAKQWEAIAAYRRLGHQGAVARELGVTRQSVGDRLGAGHRRKVEEADAAVSAYFTYLRRS